MDIPRLYNIEVDNRDLKREEYTVKDVVLPRQRIQRNTVYELVEKQRSSDTRTHPYKTLGPESVRKNFRGVVSHETGLDVVEDAVEKNDSDEAMSELRLGGYFVAGGDDGENVEADEGADRRDEVDGATTQLVDQKGEAEVLEERDGLHASIDTELSLRVGHADVVHDVLKVVADKTVARPLGEETDGSEDDDALAIAFCLEEVGPASLASLLVEFDRGFDFSKFKLHKLVVFIALTVPLGEHSESLTVAVLVAQPTGGFRHKEDTGKDDDGADGLQERGETPGPVALSIG